MTVEKQVLTFEYSAEGTTLEDIWKADDTAPDPSGMDAQVWADAFCKKFPNCGVNPDLMLTWFSNAIMAGYDEAVSRYKPAEDLF